LGFKGLGHFTKPMAAATLIAPAVTRRTKTFAPAVTRRTKTFASRLLKNVKVNLLNNPYKINLHKKIDALYTQGIYL